MTTNAYYHPRDLTIRMFSLPADLYEEIASLRGHIQSPPAPPVFTCLGNWQPLYVWQNHLGRYYLKHYPGQRCGDTHNLDGPSGPSDEHRRQAEYAARAAESGGMLAELEKTTGNGTRLDVGITGPVETIGIEIQRSELSKAQAKRRATKSFEAGWPTAWVHDTEADPKWAGHVPTARLSVRSQAWKEYLPPEGSAKVAIRKFRTERDGLRWRYRHDPYEITFDDLCILMPMGVIVPIATGKMGLVVLAFKGDQQIVDECTYQGASKWKPNIKTPESRVAAQMRNRPCVSHESDTLLAEVEKQRWAHAYTAPLPPPIAAPPPLVRQPIIRDLSTRAAPPPRCPYCDGQLLAEVSQNRGYCERCRMEGRHAF